MHDAFTLSSSPVISGIKDRVESLLLYGDKLFLGCSNGSLHIYTLNTQEEEPSATRDKVIKQFSKKSIEQLAAIKETNSLVSLSDGIVYLHDLHTYEQQTVLGSSSLTKGQANIFALETSIQTTGQLPRTAKGKEREKSQSSPVAAKRRGKGKEVIRDDVDEQEGVPLVVTTLAVGCRRRLDVFTWRDGQWQEPRETPLPHQIRSLAFPLPQSLILGFSTGEYGTATLPWVVDANSTKQATLAETFTPNFPSPAASTSVTGSIAGASSHALGAIPGMGTLGGLAAKTGGIMGLGSKVDKNIVVKVKPGEALVMKDNTAILLDASGKASRSTSNNIEYALAPEETVVSWPYILSVLPAPAAMGGLTKQQAQDPLTALPTIHIHSIPDLTPTQAVRVPPLDAKTDSARPVSIIDVPPPPVAQTARLLTTGPNGKSPMAIVTHPLAESSISTAGDTKVYLMSSIPWAQQLDSLVASGSYEEALSLLSSLENPQHYLPDAESRKKGLKILAGLSLFLHKKKYEQGIDIFIEENVNPAKVVALFPKAISGKLFLDKEVVEQVWGGRTREQIIEGDLVPGTNATRRPERRRQQTVDAGTAEEAVPGEDGKAVSTSPAVAPSWRFSPAKKKDDDTASIKSAKSKKSQSLLGPGRDREPPSSGNTINRDAQDDLSYKLSVDVLMRYLPDRRQQFLRALAALPPSSRPTPTSPLPTSPSNSPSDLFSLPDEPLSTYTPAQLQRTAQVVETALFKCYLHAKPGLLGPLCRIENWCEVEEVEELLLEAKKYKELLDLYNGKQKHEEAIKLLQRMADEPEDKPLDEKVDPIVSYLQKLGSKHLDLIFSASKWVFTLSPSAGLEIFTADMEEVETLPRHAVSLHLQKTAPPEFYAEYLEHIIFHLHEDGPEFHERLAEIYLDEVESSPKSKGPETEAPKETKAYTKLVDFLETSTQYRPGRLLGRIPDGQMYEVRAILLGRLGQHDGALQIYVYKLGDHTRAEEYCKRVFDPADPAKNDIFLTLLKVYLRPRRDSDYVPAKSTPLKPLFAPALSLLATQGTKMDTAAALELLPPLLTVKDLQIFLQKSVRRSVQTKNARKVEKRVWRARQDQIERTLVDLEGRRVKITDGRLCPQCHKRLGNSVIAIHSPRGEVTHYQCRDRWIEAKVQAGY